MWFDGCDVLDDYAVNVKVSVAATCLHLALCRATHAYAVPRRLQDMELTIGIRAGTRAGVRGRTYLLSKNRVLEKYEAAALRVCRNQTSPGAHHSGGESVHAQALSRVRMETRTVSTQWRPTRYHLPAGRCDLLHAPLLESAQDQIPSGP